MAEPVFKLEGNNIEITEANNKIYAESDYILLVTTDRANTDGNIYLGGVEWLDEGQNKNTRTPIPVPGYEGVKCLSSDIECLFVKPPTVPDEPSSTKIMYRVSLFPQNSSPLLENQNYSLNVTWSYTERPVKPGSANPPTMQNMVKWWAPQKATNEETIAFSYQLRNSVPAGVGKNVSSTATFPTTTSATDAPKTIQNEADPSQTGDSKGNESKTGTISNAPSFTETGALSETSNNKLGGASGSGLSTGAKAGIAVGAVLGVLVLVALIFLCLRRRKSKLRTVGGYFGDRPGSSNDLREKGVAVGIAAIPVSASPTSDGHHAHNGDAAMLGHRNTGRVGDGMNLERGGVGEATAPTGGVARKPIGSKGVNVEEAVGRGSAVGLQRQVLSDEEMARWEEEERRLDEDIAEAERRRLAQ